LVSVLFSQRFESPTKKYQRKEKRRETNKEKKKGSSSL